MVDTLRLENPKRALKIAKGRLGTHKRAVKKRAELEEALMKGAI